MRSGSLLNLLGFGAQFAAPAPDQPICVVGDIHGCLSQLETLLRQLPQDHQIVLLGDYVDRGEHSLQVLQYLTTRLDIICLRGNHEDMLMRFVFEGSDREGARWLTHGGMQTLASCGVAGQPEMSPEAFETCRSKLLEALGPEVIEWLKALRSSYLTGTVLVAHAGADPHVSAQDQDPQTLFWGHRDFERKARKDGLWVVHGHTIVEAPIQRNGRISIDTGAYATGVLTAAVIDETGCRFVHSTS